MVLNVTAGVYFGYSLQHYGDLDITNGVWNMATGGTFYSGSNIRRAATGTLQFSGGTLNQLAGANVYNTTGVIVSGATVTSAGLFEGSTFQITSGSIAFKQDFADYRFDSINMVRCCLLSANPSEDFNNCFMFTPENCGKEVKVRRGAKTLQGVVT
eukprot:TRINITY_DN1832_c0_g1_i2.p3 TRINITY_DN1832_c0_g1~~TRINITY_DN1832_c0_g1_i2.p3  ORF type:complete len:156 (+),score=47.96 TRINITY_DN1832_c0_g1_i2:618-1085(+)